MAGWRAMTAMATGGFRQCGPAQRRGHPPLARMRHVWRSGVGSGVLSRRAGQIGHRSEIGAGGFAAEREVV
jgi:hypothetical protein